MFTSGYVKCMYVCTMYICMHVYRYVCMYVWPKKISKGLINTTMYVFRLSKTQNINHYNSKTQILRVKH